MYKLVNQSGKPLCNANGELVTFSRYADTDCPAHDDGPAAIAP